MKIVFLIICWLVRPNAAAATESELLGQENAAWSRSIFFRGFDPTTKERLTDKKLAEFASRLERNGIRYTYIFSGPFQKDGHLPAYAFSERTRASVEYLKKMHPKVKILPWIGGVEGKTVFLEDAAWVKNSLKDTAKLVGSIPFDGVHVDLEYVLFPAPSTFVIPEKDYDAGWAQFHKKLRDALPCTFVSTVVVSSSLETRPWKHKHSVADIVEVSRVVDQLSFMFYETNLHELEAYRENIRSQLQQIRNMKDELGKKAPQYLFGIGTFKSEGSLKTYRDMRLENVPGTLAILKELTREVSPLKRIIDGLAIYCEWLTDPEDWRQIRTQWTEVKQ